VRFMAKTAENLRKRDRFQSWILQLLVGVVVPMLQGGGVNPAAIIDFISNAFR
jgi:hypothetical protein